MINTCQPSRHLGHDWYQELHRSRSWVYYWWHRYEDEGWAGLRSRYRAPEHSPHLSGTGSAEFAVNWSFLRKPSIKLLNLMWTLPEKSVPPETGVWATLEFQEDDVCLKVHDVLMVLAC